MFDIYAYKLSMIYFFYKFNNYQKKVNVCTMLICCKIRGKMQKAWEKNVAQVRECQR